jgi:ATP-dependent DNA helicase RecG
MPAGRFAHPSLTLASSVAYIKGAGPQFAKAAAALGIGTVRDLLFHLPSRYEDRRSFIDVKALVAEQEALVRARVVRAEVRFAGRRVLRVIVEQDGAELMLRFFHFNEAQRASFQTGHWVRAFGHTRAATGGLEMIHPEYRLAATAADLQPEDRFTPIYPLTAGVTQPRLRRLIAEALAVAAFDRELNSQLPGLAPPGTLEALRTIHEPKDAKELEQLRAFSHPAQRRLIDEELLAHQVCMRLLRQQNKVQRAPAIPAIVRPLSDLRAQLGFELTRAQRRVIDEIAGDVAQDRPMLRLVQGDVGSGKTVVAAAAILGAVRGGWQAALLAPTELLAEQHANNLSRWLTPLGVNVCLLKGSLRKKQRDLAAAAMASGDAEVVVGTHAMFQQSARFKRLALVVIDEQHRFGVQQRMALRDKAPKHLAPHQLVMTATPIPRTLAQTLYADLDISVIDELPPGRQPITTVALSAERRHEVLARIGAACRAGRQAYWVCTLIEESEEVEAQAAEAVAKQLVVELPDLRIALVHGRMKAAEKDAAMQAFKRGESQLLVATTVIEVGVDVPNASIMIVENAERLGLAQLHQLRGRVGRGSEASQCVQLYRAPLSEMARRRLDVMRATQDGFEIARRDLELRGPGELLGQRQTGLVGLRIADPVRDSDRAAPMQKLADEWLARQAVAAKMLVGRWVGDLQRYGQV